VNFTALKKYRMGAIIFSLLFLAVAISGKIYKGPYHWLADAYLGDLAIVGCLYFWLAFIFPGWRPYIKTITIAAVAITVELFQATDIPKSWNLPKPFVFILGSQYDANDFICYATGLAIAFLLDGLLMKKCSK
jgi:hypothetical protein